VGLRTNTNMFCRPARHRRLPIFHPPHTHSRPFIIYLFRTGRVPVAYQYQVLSRITIHDIVDTGRPHLSSFAKPAHRQPSRSNNFRLCRAAPPLYLSFSTSIPFWLCFRNLYREINMAESKAGPLVGVLALQGAFEEHQAHLEAVGCRTVQVKYQC
jgi:hypothetical protein